MPNIIKKIELDLDGQSISLTPEQARKLKEALNELFGKIIRESEPWPVTPWPIDPYPWYPSSPWIIYTSGNTATLKL